MTQGSEEFRQLDVTLWGAAALVCVSFAVLAANVSGLVPASALTALHVPQNDGVSFAQMRQQVAELQRETADLRRQNEMLATRFSLQEGTGNEIIRRVGALEVAMPSQHDMQPMASAIDRSVTTASIGKIAEQHIAADGGSVIIRRSPLPQGQVGAATDQPLPAAIETASPSGAVTGYGAVLGPSFTADESRTHWHDLQVRLGSSLADMKPLLVDAANGQQRLVVGPLPQMADARDLCQRLEQADIACAPGAYSGTPLAQ